MNISPIFPSNLTEENRKNMLRMLLGWIRFLDLKHKKEESYILDLEESLEFVFSAEIVNVRMFLAEKLKGFDSAGQKNREIHITTQEQRVFCVKLLEFVDVLEMVVEEGNIKILTDYLEVLVKMVKFYEKENENLVITKAAYIIISKCFYILGII